MQQFLDSDQLILAAPVRIELLSGCSRATLVKLRQLLSALPLFYPVTSTWQRIDLWIGHAISAGEKFGMGDLLIASIAADHEFLIWSLDSDFKRMESLGWLKLFHPR